MYSLGENDLVVDDKGRKEESTGESTENNNTGNSVAQIDDNMSPGDASQLEMLIGMGFDDAKVRKALRKFPSEDDPMCERKMEWILGGGDDEEEEELLNALMGQEEDDTTVAGASQSDKSNSKSEPDSGSSATQTSSDASDKGTHSDNSSTVPKKKVREVPQELQRLFGILEKGNAAYATTLALTQSFGWKSNHTSVQHDVHELSRVLMDVVERSLRGTPQSTLVRSLFHGTQCHQIKCLRCGLVKERSEEFGDLTLAIPRGAEFENHQDTSGAHDSSSKGGKSNKSSNRSQSNAFSSTNTSLEACLSHYFGLELLSGKNQYECDACGMRTDAEIGMRMKHLPRVLCLSLARMEYNYATGQRVKNTGKVSFPPSIDLSPYLSESRASGDTHGAGNSSENAETGNSSSIYDLYAVIVHKGQTATSGHYHAYIKDIFNLSNADGSSWPLEDDEDAEENNAANDNNVDSGDASKPNTRSKKKKKESNEEGGAAWARAEALSDLQRLMGASPDMPISSDLLSESSVWYNFDDTRVTRVSSRSLPKVFSSSECAYMFFYRQRDSVPEIDHSALSQVEYPSQLQSFIESFNEDLRIARENYEREINEISLELVTPSYLCAPAISNNEASQIINKKIPYGPPNFRWIEDEVKNGRIKVEDSSQFAPFSLVFDQRKSMGDMMAEISKLLQDNASGSLSVPSSDSLLMSLARTHHDKVLLERSFLICKSHDTGLWAVVREEKEIMPSIPLSAIPAAEGMETLASSTVKSFTLSKAQRLIFWDGKSFPVHVVRPSSSALEPRLLGAPIQGELPFLLQALYSTVRIRVYHQDKISLPSSSDTSSDSQSSDDHTSTTASESLRSLFTDNHSDLTINPTWNDICEGNISVEALNVPNPYGASSFVTTLALQIPRTISINRVLSLAHRSLLLRSLLQTENASLSLLQPNIGSENPGLSTSLERSENSTFDLEETVFDLEQRVEVIKLERWNERMETLGEVQNGGKDLNGGNLQLIDDTCGVIMAVDADARVPLVADSFQLEVATAISNASLADQDGENVNEEEEEATEAAGTDSKKANKKKKRTVDFYVILSLKMPKSSFYIRKESEKSDGDESSALATRLTLNAPLPDEEKTASSSSSDATQYHPRYVINAVPEDETLRDVVKRIYNISGLAQPPRLPLYSRLYSTDAFEQRDRIFDNFNVTVKQAQISSYSTLWLEEGEEPRPGLLQLSSKLFRLAPNKSAVDVSENPLLRPVPTLRANLLFLPLPLSSFFSPTSIAAPNSSDNAGADGIPPPPPPPPLPPTATAFLLETTQQSTLSELKDILSERIETHVRDLWRAECKKKQSGVEVVESSEVPALSFFHQYFPFDFFLASNAEDKRGSMSLWIDDQIMVDDADHNASLPLRSWRLNSWQRCNIAVLLNQTLPEHPISCIELKPVLETERSNLVFAAPAAGSRLSMEVPPSLDAEQSKNLTSIFTFIRARSSEASKTESSELKAEGTPSAPSNVPSLIDAGKYGDLSMLWITIPSAAVTKANNGNAKSKGKTNSKSPKATAATSERPQTASTRHAHLATHALADLNSLVLSFEKGLASDSDSSPQTASSSPSLVPSIPPEWLLLARVGMMPHHHGMPLPKWQLIWKPSAFVHQEESLQSNADSTVGAEGSSAEANAVEKPKAIPADEFGLGPDDSIYANRNYVLMKHLQDKKVPGSELTPTGFVMPESSKKVKFLHGDTLVYADARTWAKGGLHEDVFWDEQRRRGNGSAEDAFMSDLEKALLESSNMAARARHVEQALTIDVDF